MQQLHVTATGPDGKPIHKWGHLENFHKKFNKVLLDKLAIAEEKKRLLKENTDLRSILKQYLDGIAVTEDAVDRDNPLLIVNGRVNLLDREKKVQPFEFVVGCPDVEIPKCSISGKKKGKAIQYYRSDNSRS